MIHHLRTLFPRLNFSCWELRFWTFLGVWRRLLNFPVLFICFCWLPCTFIILEGKTSGRFILLRWPLRETSVCSCLTCSSIFTCSWKYKSAKYFYFQRADWMRPTQHTNWVDESQNCEKIIVVTNFAGVTWSCIVILVKNFFHVLSRRFVLESYNIKLVCMDASLKTFQQVLSVACKIIFFQNYAR